MEREAAALQYPPCADASGILCDMPRASLKCCCGRLDCAYLQHNTSALEELERDVKTAAQLGQALLNRHQCYMAEAEGDRSRMVEEIERLELGKLEVQAENKRVIEENRDLLEQLEGLNKAIAESDAHVKSLTTKLENTQLEVRRLAVTASRVAQLEEQLSEMEIEQYQLHERLAITEEDGRSAVQRWKQAERTIRDLHDQLDRIEHESREEREKHVELLARVERRRAVEKELAGAAGRLKGAAAASTLRRSQNGTHVMSHFVRDILQDNANLQLGIIELREMLQSSNEEVQNLRELIHLHQPLDSESSQVHQQNPPLSEELEATMLGSTSKEFHVHHHFHVSPPSTVHRKDKIPYPLHRRQKGKRIVLASRTIHPPSALPTPRIPASHRAHGSASSTATILSHTSVSIPPPIGPYRWSIQSSSTTSTRPALLSLPSSPTSPYRSSSIFDRADPDLDSSRPTTPDSSGFESPDALTRHRKGLSDVSFQSLTGSVDQPETIPPLSLNSRQSAPEAIVDMRQSKRKPVEAECTTRNLILSGFHQLPIHEEREELPSLDFARSEAELGLCPASDDAGVSPSPIGCQLKHSTSHGSLLSISGMDIHTLRNQLPQLLGRDSTLAARTPSRIASTGTILLSTPPVISPTNIMATKASVASGGTAIRTPFTLLSSVAAANSVNGTSIPSLALPTAQQTNPPLATQTVSLGKRLEGWVLGKWGVAPIPSTENLSPRHSPHSQIYSSSSPHPTSFPRPFTTAPAIMARSPGVNQKGPIPGFMPYRKPPSAVHADMVDETLLRESLLE